MGEKRSYLPNEVTVTDAISSGWIPLLALQVYSPSIADAWFVMTNVRFLWINFRSLYHVIVGSGPPRAVQVSIKSSPGTRALIGSNGFIRGGSVSRNNKKHILETIKKFPNCLFFFGISPRLKRHHEPSRSFLRYSYERFALLTFFCFPEERVHDVSTIKTYQIEKSFLVLVGCLFVRYDIGTTLKNAS